MPQRRAIRHLPFLFVSAMLLLGQGQPASRATASNASLISPPAATYKAPIGQTLNYAVEWRLFDAGVATIRMENAGREQRVVSTADARGVVGLLYHVHDRFESFFDAQTNCSRTIEKKTEEGFRRLETNIVFDIERKKSVLNEKNLKNNTSKREEHETPGCVTDVNSALFYLASQPLAAGATMLFPLNDGGKTVNVKATVETREEIKVPAGTYKTVRVLAVSTNATKNKGQVQIWFTDDDRRLPVQMKAKLFWGTLTFRLK